MPFVVKHKANFFQEILAFISSLRVLFLGLFILAITGIAFQLMQPYIVRLIIDKAYAQKNMLFFVYAMAGLASVTLANSICFGVFNHLQRIARMRITLALHRSTFSAINRQPYAFFKAKSGGEQMSLFLHDIEQVALTVVSVLAGICINIPKLFLLIGIVVWLDWRLAGIVFLAAPLLYAVLAHTTGFIQKAQRDLLTQRHSLSKLTYEFFSRILLVKLFRREKTSVSKYLRGVIHFIRASVRWSRTEAVVSFATQATTKTALGIVVLYGGWRIIHGEMTLGLFTAIALYLGQLSGVFQDLAKMAGHVTQSGVSWERMYAVLQTPRVQGVISRVQCSAGEIVAQEMAFGYGAQRRIFDGVSMKIPAGTFLALTGPSGCGKTTFFNIVMGLYPLEKGALLIDGHDISRVNPDVFYRNVGMVTQEPYLWDDTVEYNIRFGKPDASDEEIRFAASVACADSFIQALPKGYQTVVGENACRLSEGQKQRIAIARAVIRSPRLLLFDEALSSVDQEIEARILDNLKSLPWDMTALIISHRFSTIQKMDSICFIAGPAEWYHGNHALLLKDVPAYGKYLNAFT